MIIARAVIAAVGVLAALICVQSGHAGAAEFSALTPSTPQLAAFQQWHQAVVAGDFKRFLQLSAELEGADAQARQAVFQDLRRTVPSVVKVTTSKTLPTGAVEFYAAGCKDNKRHVALIIVAAGGEGYRILSTGWAPPSNKTASDCPV